MWRRAADSPTDTAKTNTAMPTAAALEWTSHHHATAAQSCASSSVDATNATNATGDLVAEPVTIADPHILNWDPDVEKLLDVDDTRPVSVMGDTATIQQHEMMSPAPPSCLMPSYLFDASRPSVTPPPPPPPPTTASFWPPSSDGTTALDMCFTTAACHPCDATMTTQGEEKMQTAINITTGCNRTEDVLTEPNDSGVASKLNQGSWLFVASYVNGEDQNRDAFVIVWASPNASESMFGIGGLDLTGFPIHPNPADFFCAEPRLFTNRPHGTQYRWKPFGGQNDLGSMIYVDTRVVRESSGYLLILAADLVQHGPISEHDVHRLDRLGVFSSLDVGFSRPARWTWPPLNDPPAERHHDTMRRMGFSLWMHKLNRSLQALDLVAKCAFPVLATFQSRDLFGNQTDNDQGHHTDRDWLTLIRVPFLDQTLLSDLQISQNTGLRIMQNRSP